MFLTIYKTLKKRKIPILRHPDDIPPPSGSGLQGMQFELVRYSSGGAAAVARTSLENKGIKFIDGGTEF